MDKEKKEPKEKIMRKRRPRLESPAVGMSASDKVQAVLAVWTERAKPSEVCRQLGINPITFSQWQNRAMEGMLQSLESRVNLAAGQCLNPRLRQLLSRRSQSAAMGKLETKLAKLAGTSCRTEEVAG